MMMIICTTTTNSNNPLRVLGLTSSQHNHQSLSSSRFKDKVSERIANIKQEREESSNEAKKLRVKSEAAISSAEEEIARIRALLPPIDYEAAALDETFDVYNNVDEYGDNIVCTCVQREVISYLGDEDDALDLNVVKPPAISLHNEDDDDDDDVVVEVKNGKNGKIVAVESDDDDDDETDDFCAVDEVDDVLKSPPPIQAAVKSIFDPEYDANENLIEEMVQRKRNSTKVIEVKVDKEAVKSNRVQPIADVAAIAAFPPQNSENQDENCERVPITNYVFDEDPMCPARAYFLKDQVPQRKLDLFHRSYMPGWNGHWNGVESESSKPDYAADNEHIDYAKHQLWKRVVPRYDFLTCDRIPKTTLNDGSPFSIPPPPPPPSEEDVTAAGIKQEPFDGLAKMMKSNNSDIEFREWHECMNVRSYNDEVLTILPYVIID